MILLIPFLILNKQNNENDSCDICYSVSTKLSRDRQSRLHNHLTQYYAKKCASSMRANYAQIMRARISTQLFMSLVVFLLCNWTAICKLT